ncbi:hypothetical protein PW52_01495 [Tamlana sedimentorum]|uniref:Secretion system C-terminal sorting domain-containing protein n=1 Tax=Neotamlana sedimentorum TaxID=1435349 RepID=A0A0D7WDG3_9FLAO|nr:T9SS type A sorting domain-containing protein [Tamlana sedimentorum]KJD37156.1 hypothetical protein PW52_01495 [Tamlana sedimentorum]
MKIKQLLFITLFLITIRATAQDYAQIPFFDNFDTGTLNSNWVATPDTANNGFIDLHVGSGIDGSFGLRLGKTSDAGDYATNYADLHLNLENKKDVFLSFSIKSYYEESHFQDGIYFSDDGGATFLKVYAFNAEDWCNNIWGEFPPFNIDELAGSVGLNLTNQFVIRFQQYDNADFSTANDEDGFIFDNVSVKSKPIVYASLPFEDDFDIGTGVLGDSWLWAHADKTVAPLTGTVMPTGRVGITNGFGTDNSFGVAMGNWCDGSLTANALDLHLNLENQTDVFLSFSIRSFAEESHFQDGLFLSDDGGLTFQKAFEFTAEDWCNNTWGEFPPFNIGELAASVGLNLTNQFVIRFQQYDNADFSTANDEDGFILDNISVKSRPIVYASLPFEDDFDIGTGILGDSWSWVHADKTVAPLTGAVMPTGRVDIAGGQGTDSSFGLMMGNKCDGNYVANALDLHLNLENQTDVFLSFSIRDYGEESHFQDGLFLSDDGGLTFLKAFEFTAADWCNDTWGEFPPFNIDELAASVGLSLTNQFVIRFQQYDNADFSTANDEDGFVLDNVSVKSRAIVYAGLPYEENFDDGTLELSESLAWTNADDTVFPITDTNKPTGYVAITNASGTNSSFGLQMGKICDDGFTANALDVHLNLENYEDVTFSFSIRPYHEESQPAQDAIFFSNDGGISFESIYQFDFNTMANNTWDTVNLDLDDLVSAKGLSFSSESIVRFQQYDNADFSTANDEDGIILDNLNVTGTVLSTEDLLLEQSKFLVYPNPITSSKINMVLPNNVSNETVEIQLFSLRGELIFKENTIAQKQMTLALPKQNLSGVYFLNIKGYNFNSTQKVVFSK